MVNKLTKLSTVHRVGIRAVRVFSIYSKKKFKTLKFFGVIKGSVRKVSKGNSRFMSYRTKGYVVKTKKTRSRLDGSYILFFFNKLYLKSKKFGKKKINYGCSQKIIKHRKLLYKFVNIINVKL
jgi:ribosomal protein L14